MNKSTETSSFKERLTANVGQFDLSGKTLLIPDMAPFGSRLLAAGFRAYGVPAKVMETYTGLALGKEYTSGKECFPCQVTLGDVLHFLQNEKDRLGNAFNPENYVYFMPEADGPCRFGMYNKLHRLVLDKFPEFENVAITYLSTADGYQSSMILPPEKSKLFRRLAYVATIIADVMDRTVWRVRPYEKVPGSTDEFMEQALIRMERAIEGIAETRNFKTLYSLLSEIVAEAKELMDTNKPRKPRIGIIGEIYLRTHPRSNQDIIKEIEANGGEVVDASLGEWINFVTYSNLRETRRSWVNSWKNLDISGMFDASRKWIDSKIEIQYQLWRQNQVYSQAFKHLDIQGDHSISLLEERLDKDRLFNFDIGTEAAISIGGALEYVHENFHGVVNVFPFTCMPSVICSSILKPMLLEKKVPYLDAPYDGSIQPNRDIAIRTFMYQAAQRQLRHSKQD
ncbi:CoA activase [Desulfonatronovibrio magnus]|uniref:CoA activase n=1 Tax=Desulfonatronovibrio magnus TaxID=698827 RepID=UPI0005EB1ED6|nr:CoA activase [Desulfonatronovibrio magnus]RQD56926.1 MAG: CoA activase [Desulfonatronovibrio sp. MSAO_Bac4]